MGRWRFTESLSNCRKALLGAGFAAMLLFVLHLLGDLLEIGSRSAHFAASLFYNRVSRVPKGFSSLRASSAPQTLCIGRVVDARLPDGSRVNVIVPPLAVDGPIVSIRRFGSTPLSAHDLIVKGAYTPEMLEVLQKAVKARLNIVVSGGTGAGKTTLLNVLSSFISERERIVTIEDSAELQLKQEHVVRLECRPA